MKTFFLKKLTLYIATFFLLFGAIYTIEVLIYSGSAYDVVENQEDELDDLGFAITQEDESR